MIEQVDSIETVNSQQSLADACAATLRLSGWQLKLNAPLAVSPKGSYLRADILAQHIDSGRRVAAYPRWQANSGSAEEKLPFHMIKFEIALAERPDIAERAFFVIEGRGWSWREFYLADGLSPYLAKPLRSSVVSLAEFKNLARNGLL